MERISSCHGIAVAALNAPPPAGDYWQGWLPDAEDINALPQPVRKYIHDLETNVDPAGIVAENALLRDTVAALQQLKPTPDLDGWEAYCETCGAFGEARRVGARDASDDTEYFEFLCNTCHSILLTFQRSGTQKAEDKPARPVAFARCPHCGELNSFPGFEEIFAYVCKHCGKGVEATPPLQ